jgi:HEAT repeat protein
VLIGLTAAKDEKLRLAAIDALGTLAAKEAGPTLLTLLEDSSATIRLRAAVALSRAGGADIVKPTIARLSAAQADRLAVVLALNGILERHGDDASLAIARDAAATAGGERDLLIVAVGRSKGSATPALRALLEKGASDLDGRRAVAVALGARDKDPAAPVALVALAADADAAVRAQASWSLGAVGTAAELPLVLKLAKDAAPGVAANAAAAIGRIVVRAKVAAPKELCPLLDDERPYVRANALASVRHLLANGMTATCDDGKERKLLADDPNDVVRAAAARVITLRIKGDTDPAAKARTALERCALADPSGAVASVCREGAIGIATLTDSGSASLIVFVAPDDGGAPIARTPYAIERPDGFLHVGAADRRGAVVELLLGRGPLRLRVATPAAGTATET